MAVPSPDPVPIIFHATAVVLAYLALLHVALAFCGLGQLLVFILCPIKALDSF
jgi:hypothetical protein